MALKIAQETQEEPSLGIGAFRVKSKIQAAEIKILRIIKSVIRRDGIRNVDIKIELSDISVLKLVERSKFQ